MRFVHCSRESGRPAEDNRKPGAGSKAVARSLPRVGIGDPETVQDGRLARLHPLRLGVVLVVVALRVQRAVDHEVREMVAGGDPCGLRFGEHHGEADHNVGLHLRGAGIGEGEHVGGPVAIAIRVVEAASLGLDALVEVHSEEELETALDIGADLIGINNRDLRTFVTDLAVTERLMRHVPPDTFVVSESGISSPADIGRVAQAGCRAVLVGEHFMRQPDVERAVKELMGDLCAERAAERR